MGRGQLVRFSSAMGAVALSVGLVSVSVPAYASLAQSSVVSTNPMDGTPDLLASTAVAHPHVDAIAVGGGTTYAGGLFDMITQGGTSRSVSDLMAFNSSTGTLSANFQPPAVSGGQVRALAVDPSNNALYVGGDFSSIGSVNGSLLKLNATTGAVISTFTPPFRRGVVHDVQLVTIGGAQRLVVGGNMGKHLYSLNPGNGTDDGYFNETIADPIPNAWGGVSVYHFAVDHDATHLVATGNFKTVDPPAGVTGNRTRFFMLNLGSNGATLSPWYYPGFAKSCSSTAARRIAYLQGIDWSPDGSAFDVTATGQIPASKSDIWYQRLGTANRPNTTVCDGVGRFNLADSSKPAWINYTGGDSVWAVADTGAAVYVQGHFKWLDNPDGYASLGIGDTTSGAPAASRTGIGAIDPRTGLALSWNPGVTSRVGGKALVATATGLWVGSDSARFRNEHHYGIAFAPLP